MKRFIQLVSVILVLSTILTTPAFAAEQDMAPWGSNYFSSRLGYLYETSATQFQVWIQVTAVGTMEELGASEIVVQRSSDNVNWTNVKTYTKDAYTNMVGENKFSYQTYVTYSGTTGYYYRAEIIFYAKKGTGEAEYPYTTDSIQL